MPKLLVGAPFVPLSRRSALFACVCSCFAGPARVLAFSDSHFWDKEDPSAWTPDQVSQLTTDSPWAKQVTADLNENNSSGPTSTTRMGGRGGRRGGVAGGGSSPSNLPKFKAVIRWASATPIRTALKLKFPDSLAGHYVISVSGVPIMSPPSAGEDENTKPGNDPFAGLKEQTSLQLKRGEPIEPGVAYEDPSDTSTIYFGFLPQLARVTEAKTATFSMNTGPLAVKAKFNISEMKYRGELAV
ncbi:MAG: hypothetical protein WB676_19260 [Bryobacteraceae bacterium]